MAQRTPPAESRGHSREDDRRRGQKKDGQRRFLVEREATIGQLNLRKVKVICRVRYPILSLIFICPSFLQDYFRMYVISFVSGKNNNNHLKYPKGKSDRS